MIGDRIFWSGDDRAIPGFGTVKSVAADGLSVYVALDSGHSLPRFPIARIQQAFNGGPGQLVTQAAYREYRSAPRGEQFKQPNGRPRMNWRLGCDEAAEAVA
ncbi:MAG: hypothetical protein AB7H77_09290 [Bdellovibrionales bacterium]